MKVIRNPRKLQKEMERLRSRRLTIGFVPTMGALHEGHLSLVRKARKENRVVVVSIFVNLLQFVRGEDFQRYPHKFRQDARALRKEKVDFLFLPSRQSLYPADYQTFVEVPQLSQGLCGRFRPGHFRGVVTIVTKLLNLVRPHRAYFGLKDYQQAVVIKRLAQDLNFNVAVKMLPLVRDRDGLALSSRNAFLSKSGRERALALSRSLRWAKSEIERGRRNLASIREGVLARLRRNLSRIDYVEFVEAENLQPVRTLRGKTVLAVAGWVGKTRLIDNAIIQVS